MDAKALIHRSESKTGPLVQFELPHHIRACKVGTAIVLLDLDADNYFGVCEADALALAPWILNWPVRNQQSSGTTQVSHRPSLLCDMLASGIVVPLSSSSQVLSPHIPKVPTTSLVDSYPTLKIKLTARDFYFFLYATIYSKILLRRKSLKTAVGHAMRIDGRNAFNSQPHTAVELRREKVYAFRKLWSLFYRSREACLFESLSLLLFFCCHRLPAQWFIGVALHPFSAHAWLQFDDIVLNDTVENVRRYQPILTV